MQQESWATEILIQVGRGGQHGIQRTDFEMHLKLQKLLGPSTGKGVNDVEKTLYKVQQSMLPIFSVLAFLESKELEGDAKKAVPHLAELIGRSFFDVSDLRRRNILELVGPAIIPLLEDRDIFEVSERRDLFMGELRHEEAVEE